MQHTGPPPLTTSGAGSGWHRHAHPGLGRHSRATPGLLPLGGAAMRREWTAAVGGVWTVFIIPYWHCITIPLHTQLYIQVARKLLTVVNGQLITIVEDNSSPHTCACTYPPPPPPPPPKPPPPTNPYTYAHTHRPLTHQFTNLSQSQAPSSQTHQINRNHWLCSLCNNVPERRPCAGST